MVRICAARDTDAVEELNSGNCTPRINLETPLGNGTQKGK